MRLALLLVGGLVTELPAAPAERLVPLSRAFDGFPDAQLYVPEERDAFLAMVR